MPNSKEMTIKLTRGEVCDLLLAISAAKGLANDGGKKWTRLHEKVYEQLEKFDEANNI